MKKNIIVTFICIITILITKTNVSAQANFNGSWSKTGQESLSGPNYGNALPSKVVFTKSPQLIEIEQTRNTGIADTTFKDQIILNGEPQKAKTSIGSTKVITANCKELLIDESVKYLNLQNPNQIDYTIDDRWEMSTDGKTLTLTRTFTSNTDAGNKWSMKGTYEKQ